MKENKEVRAVLNGLEVRASGEADSSGNTLTGYAIKFNDVTTIGGQFEERVSPSALEGVDMSGTLALWNHDYSSPIGKAGKNMRMSMSTEGLKVDIDLPDTTVARDLSELVRAGVVEGMSFGFTVADDTWEQRDGLPLRTIDKIGELYEVTFTPIPAYPTTEVAMRSLEASSSDEVPSETTADPVDEVTPEVQEVPKFTATEILEAAPEGNIESFLKKVAEKFG